MKLREVLKNRILWKIYLIWFLRRIVPLILLQVLALGLVLQLFSKNVFVSQVLRNAGLVASDNYLAILKYLAKAFLNTHLITQLVIFGGLSVFALLIRDF